MTDTEYELYNSLVQLRYIFSWFKSRSALSDYSCGPLINPYISREERNRLARELGGRICDFEHMTKELRKEWDNFLKLKKKVKKEQNRQSGGSNRP